MQVGGLSAGITFATSNKTTYILFLLLPGINLGFIIGEKKVVEYKRGITRFICSPLEGLVMDNARALPKITSR